MSAVASSSSSATAQNVHKNESLYSNIDPENIKYPEEGDRGSSFLQTKSGTANWEMESPPVFTSRFTEDTFEGNLGHKFEYQGKTIQELDRTKCKFQVPVGMGGETLDDDIRVVAEPLLAKQHLFFVKLYAASCAAMKNIFEQRVDSFTKHIEKAEEAAAKDEMTRVNTPKDTVYESVDDVDEAAEKDAELRARLKAAALVKFIESAQLPPNPAEYDAKGYKKRTRKSAADEKPKRIQIKLTRKVWKSTKPYSPGATPDPRKSVAELPCRSIDTWPQVVADAGENYKWQPFKYTKLDETTGNVTELVRPQFKDKATDKMYDDPSWSPFRDHESLIQATVSLQAYSATAMYGLRLIPNVKLFIFKSVPCASAVKDVEVDNLMDLIREKKRLADAAKTAAEFEERVEKRAKTAGDDE